MTNKDLSAYSKTIFICFIICLFKRGKKMQDNCILSLAEAFLIHYFLFTYLIVSKQFPAVKLFNRSCYLDKQKNIVKIYQPITDVSSPKCFDNIWQGNCKSKTQKCLEQFAFHILVDTSIFSQKKYFKIFTWRQMKKKCFSWFNCFDWIKYS